MTDSLIIIGPSGPINPFPFGTGIDIMRGKVSIVLATAVCLSLIVGSGLAYVAVVEVEDNSINVIARYCTVDVGDIAGVSYVTDGSTSAPISVVDSGNNTGSSFTVHYQDYNNTGSAYLCFTIQYKDGSEIPEGSIFELKDGSDGGSKVLGSGQFKVIDGRMTATISGIKYSESISDEGTTVCPTYYGSIDFPSSLGSGLTTQLTMEVDAYPFVTGA